MFSSKNPSAATPLITSLHEYVSLQHWSLLHQGESESLCQLLLCCYFSGFILVNQEKLPTTSMPTTASISLHSARGHLSRFPVTMLIIICTTFIIITHSPLALLNGLQEGPFQKRGLLVNMVLIELVHTVCPSHMRGHMVTISLHTAHSGHLCCVIAVQLFNFFIARINIDK